MKITNIDVKKIEKKEKPSLKGVATITFDNCFVVKSVMIIKSLKDGELFLSFPSRKDNLGIYRNICHPINKEMRSLITEKVLEKYNEL